MEQDIQLKAVGNLDIVLRDEFGNVKDERHVKNLVVTVGREYIAARMSESTPPALMSHMAIGTSTTAVSASNTALLAQAHRKALTSTTRNSATVTYAATFNAGEGTGAITEAGVFNDGTTGTMLCRTVFAVVNKSASDSLTINWSVSISAV